jgi:acyl-CoA synthetase (AMP-forming)/AMP-acid ligase II
LWVKVGGEGFETRVIDGMLEIKAKSAMLGYLNAPSPFTEDGWFKTGDAVVTNGEYIKILGRKSEIINVGGEKVYPQEIEDVILELDNVSDVTVYGEKNPIMGNIVCARIRLRDDTKHKGFLNEIKIHCRKELQNYKVPVKIFLENELQYSERFKKKR